MKKLPLEAVTTVVGHAAIAAAEAAVAEAGDLKFHLVYTVVTVTVALDLPGNRVDRERIQADPDYHPPHGCVRTRMLKVHDDAEQRQTDARQ